MLDRKKLSVTVQKMAVALDKAKRSLFELETIKSAWEINQGNFKVFSRPQDLFAKLKIRDEA